MRNFAEWAPRVLWGSATQGSTLKASVLAIATLLASNTAHAISIFDFPPTVFTGIGAAEQSAMDANLGITGFMIEDFEDGVLIPGLTVEYEGLGELGAIPAGDLINLADGIWDGTLGLNPIPDPTTPDVVFRIAGGTDSFGIGVTDIEAENLGLFVNDIDFGLISDFPNYSRTADNSREVYLRIDAGTGESITNVTLRNLATGADGLLFDHVALGEAMVPTPNPIPEPATITLLGLSLALLSTAHRRRTKP